MGGQHCAGLCADRLQAGPLPGDADSGPEAGLPGWREVTPRAPQRGRPLRGGSGFTFRALSSSNSGVSRKPREDAHLFLLCPNTLETANTHVFKAGPAPHTTVQARDTPDSCFSERARAAASIPGVCSPVCTSDPEQRPPPPALTASEDPPDAHPEAPTLPVPRTGGLLPRLSLGPRRHHL